MEAGDLPGAAALHDHRIDDVALEPHPDRRSRGDTARSRPGDGCPIDRPRSIASNWTQSQGRGGLGLKWERHLVIETKTAESRAPQGSGLEFRRVPLLDGLRAVAIGLVLLAHTFPRVSDAGAGVVGVELFFVLSGFLITSLLVSEWSRAQRISLGRFYGRRALRLFPALFALLAVASIYGLLFDHDAADRGRLLAGVVATALYVGDYLMALGHNPGRLLEQTWSLSVEEQFYFLWPVVLLLLLRARQSLEVMAWLVAGAVVVDIAWRVMLYGHADSARLYYAFDTQADALLVGCFVGLICPMARRGWAGWTTKAFFVGGTMGAGILLADSIGALSVSSRLGDPLMKVSAGAVMLLLATRPPAVVTRILSHRVMIWLGAISYSLYIWHVAVFRATGPGALHVSRLLAGPIRLSLTLAVAVVSFYAIESPFLRLKHRLSSGPARSTAASAGEGQDRGRSSGDVVASARCNGVQETATIRGG